MHLRSRQIGSFARQIGINNIAQPDIIGVGLTIDMGDGTLTHPQLGAVIAEVLVDLDLHCLDLCQRRPDIAQGRWAQFKIFGQH